MSTDDSKKVAALLQAVPNGVQAMSSDIEGLGPNLPEPGHCTGGGGSSASHLLRPQLCQRGEGGAASAAADIAGEFGGSYSQMGEYPAWEYQKDSLRELMVEVYREMFGSEPQVVAIHAGLSAAFWATSCPGWIAFPMVPRCRTFTPAGRS